MKFSIKNNGGSLLNLMRKAGYFFLEDRTESDEMSFIRPMERHGYPRFHIYLKIDKGTHEIFFNLHLDQKRPVYKGVSAHAGEYEGTTVEREAERIKSILSEL